jgi:hypothetical protein
LLRQLSAREAAAARDLASAREEVVRQSASKNRYVERTAELDTQLTRLKAEHRAELAGMASDKKELQTQVGRAGSWRLGISCELRNSFWHPGQLACWELQCGIEDQEHWNY